jgi:hypothetical protein
MLAPGNASTGEVAMTQPDGTKLHDADIETVRAPGRPKAEARDLDETDPDTTDRVDDDNADDADGDDADGQDADGVDTQDADGTDSDTPPLAPA